jgi:hypothetical protein
MEQNFLSAKKVFHKTLNFSTENAVESLCKHRKNGCGLRETAV